MNDTEQTVLVNVPMPQMGVSTTEGTILAWSREVGDAVEVDDVLCEISTDKVDSEVASPVAGRLAELLVSIGETVAVGTPIARISTTPAAADELARDAPRGGPASDAPVTGDAPSPIAIAVAPHVNSLAKDGRRHSPVVRRIAQAHDVDLTAVEGTGRGGRVTKRDALAHVAAGPKADTASPVTAPASAPASSRTEPLSRMRRAIAANMLRSKATAPHAHTWIEVDMSRVERERRVVGTTALAFVARATIDALRLHPAVNAWIQDDDRTLHRDVHLGIAVALDDEGLIVPVIHDAQELSVEGLAARIRDLANRARTGDLRPDEVQGGTFTITNPGRFGSLMAAPIINQPQVAILDLEAIAKRPVVVTDEAGNDALAIRPTSIFGLAWDHRAIDGALAARFLATIRDRLQDWPAGAGAP
jgi:pyruvate/2-oxoglutarate dehydrogenase complex dihydrolipoamide acyltransferase (E2) component